MLVDDVICRQTHEGPRDRADIADSTFGHEAPGERPHVRRPGKSLQHGRLDGREARENGTERLFLAGKGKPKSGVNLLFAHLITIAGGKPYRFAKFLHIAGNAVRNRDDAIQRGI